MCAQGTRGYNTNGQFGVFLQLLPIPINTMIHLLLWTKLSKKNFHFHDIGRHCSKITYNLSLPIASIICFILNSILCLSAVSNFDKPKYTAYEHRLAYSRLTQLSAWEQKLVSKIFIIVMPTYPALICLITWYSPVVCVLSCVVATSRGLRVGSPRLWNVTSKAQ